MSSGAPSEGGSFGRFEVFTAERRLHVDGKPVALGSRAFDLLAALVARRERVVPKEELIELVWPGLVVEDNNLQVQISALRKVMGAQAIATVPGRGYQFTVAAAAANVALNQSAPVSVQASAAHRARLLVADDNKVNRLLLCRSLELMGHEVASADNGRTALEKLRAGGFDLLLLDLEMPEVDGFGLLEQRAGDAALREVPVIVTSSLEGVAAVARCIELGADDYLHKPVNPVLLKARVDSSLERKRLRDRPDSLHATRGHHTAATLLAARLVGIEALAAAQPAQETLELLSHWATLMVDAIEGHGGLVNQMTGDGLTAVFGTQGSRQTDQASAWAAVQAALEMRELAALFNAEREASGKPPVGLSIGIASGEVVAGHAGTPRRSSHVCVGPAVQRAAALEALAGQRGGASLIDAATHAALGSRAPAGTPTSLELPGSTEAVYALKA